MQAHIYTPLYIQLCILFQAEKPIPVALVLTLLLVPQTLWGIRPPHAKGLEPPKQSTPLTLRTVTFESRPRPERDLQD